MQWNAIFLCKESKFNSSACEVEKIIELDAGEYARFRRDMLQDYDFIARHNPLMRVDTAGRVHCLLVLGEGSDDGIMVNSEGSNYARYAAFIPGARQILAAEEQCMEQEFMSRINRIGSADLSKAQSWMEHARALAGTEVGKTGPTAHYQYERILYEFGSEFRKVARQNESTAADIFNHKAGYKPEDLWPVAAWIQNGHTAEEAYERFSEGYYDSLDDVVNGVVAHGIGCLAEIADTYRLKEDQIPQLIEKLREHEGIAVVEVDEENGSFGIVFRQGLDASDSLTQDDLTAIHARHTLWLLEQPDGVAADFSGRILDGLYFEWMQFPGASFAGATLNQCSMDGGLLSDCDFTGAVMRDTTASEANFSGAYFDNAKLTGCAFDKALLDDASFAGAEITNCTGLEDIAQGPAMQMGG